MLPHRPHTPNPDFVPDCAPTPRPSLSQNAALAAVEPAPPPFDHHCQFCPTCSHRLTGHRCKLVCTHCGYYMSCADYY